MAKPKKWNKMSAAEQATENEARAAAKATRMAAEKAALAAESEKVAGPAENGRGKGSLRQRAGTRVETPAITTLRQRPGTKVETPAITTLRQRPGTRVETPAVKAPAVAAPSTEISLPHRTPPNQGSMVGKPAISPVIEVPPGTFKPGAVAKWNEMSAAGRPIVPQTGSVADSMRASMQAGRGAASWRVDDEVKAAYESSLKMGRRAMQSTGQKVASTATKVAKWSGTAMGKGFLAVGKSAIEPIINPIRSFRAGAAARRASWEAAGPVGKAAQTVATTAKVGWAGVKTAGGIARGIGYGIAADMGHDFAGHYGEVKADREIEAESRAEYGRKHGLKVTTAPPSLLRMVTGGSPKIKVEEVDKSLRAKKLAQGQAKHNELTYNALKKVASRNVIRGGS